MNNIFDLLKELAELQRIAREGVSVDDMRVEGIMMALVQFHNQDIDNNGLLDAKQKERRKELYAEAVKGMNRYCKQVLKDEKEISKKR
jgi:hypothetical protein